MSNCRKIMNSSNQEKLLEDYDPSDDDTLFGN